MRVWFLNPEHQVAMGSSHVGKLKKQKEEREKGRHG